ncbi:MAG: MalY/PatB family protein [Bacillota bacterium]|jgi:cystathionine beta-lyase|nr:pyridoxal phosphate-dependent aminotransferase [Candidatus Fermentithermobacillaceae bacterium]
MRYDFDKVIERRNTGSSKWDNLKALFGSDDVLPLWVADMDFRIPQPIIDAISERIKHPVFGYTRVGAGAIGAVTQRLESKYGWKVSPESVVITPGVVPAVNAAVRAYAGEGGAVVVQSPAYPPFWATGPNNKVRTVTNLLRFEGGRYEMDFEALERAFAESGAKAMILCSPHNPVGRVWSREELVRVGEIALKAGAVVISDEIHCELVLKGYKHIPFASISPEFEANSITCFAPSKTFNVPGMHCSVAIIPDEDMRKRFNEARVGIQGTPAFLAIIAMEAAFRHGDEWLEQVLDYIEGNLEFLIKYMEERIPAIKPVRPEGTYLVWLDCRGLGIEDPKELQKFFNEKAKVGMNAGYTFGPGGEGFMRMNIACPRSTLEEALKRIEEAVKLL